MKSNTKLIQIVGLASRHSSHITEITVAWWNNLCSTGQDLKKLMLKAERLSFLSLPSSKLRFHAKMIVSCSKSERNNTLHTKSLVIMKITPALTYFSTQSSTSIQIFSFVSVKLRQTITWEFGLWSILMSRQSCTMSIKTGQIVSKLISRKRLTDITPS